MIVFSELHILVLGLLLIAGLAMLCFGGDWLARGAASLAINLKINPIVVGLTIVSIATSMPELIAGFIAAWKGLPGLAVGNIVGSNLGNIGLILGVAAMVSPVIVERRLVVQELPLLIVITLVFSVFCFSGSFFVDGAINRVEGILLLLGAVAYLVFIVKNARKGDGAEVDDDELSAESADSFPLSIGLVLLGSVLLAIGGYLLVSSAEEVATRMELSEELIGLTIVAIGTSLPELAASVAAAMRKQSGLIAGNVIGSNIFNMLLIGGGVASCFPLTVDRKLFLDAFPSMIALTVFMWILFALGGNVSRKEGARLLVLYFGIIIFSWLTQTGRMF